MLATPPLPVRKARRATATREELSMATPVQLLNMLFARLMLDLERGRLALESHDYQEANRQLLHAQAILTELSGSLNMDTWGGARNLYSIYQWCETSVQRANINKKPQFVADAIRQLEPIQTAWQQAASSPEVSAMNQSA